MSQIETPVIPRDARIDHIGFVTELQKQFVEPLKGDVKGRMLANDAREVQGDFFTAQLAGVGSSVGTLDPVKVFRRVKQGLLTEAQFLECCRIERGKLEEYVSGKDLDRMTEFVPATPQLRITRKKGVELKLVDALKGLGSAIKDDR